MPLTNPERPPIIDKLLSIPPPGMTPKQFESTLAAGMLKDTERLRRNLPDDAEDIIAWARRSAK